jgi:hypothetical protein
VPPGLPERRPGSRYGGDDAWFEEISPVSVRPLAPLILLPLVVGALAGCSAGPAAGSGGSPAAAASAASTATDTATDTVTDSPSDSSGPGAATDGATASDPAADPAAGTAGSSTSAARPPASPAATDQPLITPPPGGLGTCRLPYLRVTARPGGARTSHAGYLLLFTNTGQVSCEVQGYPAVTVLDAAGRASARAGHTASGYLGGVRSGRPVVPAFVLLPGGVASALLEGEVIDVTGAACPGRPALQVSPPADPGSVRLAITTGICGGVQVHPLVNGASGNN